MPANQEANLQGTGVQAALVARRPLYPGPLAPVAARVAPDGPMHVFVEGAGENVFAIKGLGRVLIQGILNRDYPVVLGTLYIFGLMGLVVKLISDLMYVWIDPRIDFERRAG